MYLELIRPYQAAGKGDGGIRPQPPATEAEISCAERQTGVQFPQELRSLLAELNGDCDLLLSTDAIVEYHQYDLSRRYPKGALLFFGSDGAGNLYGYRVRPDHTASPGIVFWDHELDSVTLLPPERSSLQTLIPYYYDLCYGGRASDEA